MKRLITLPSLVALLAIGAGSSAPVTALVTPPENATVAIWISDSTVFGSNDVYRATVRWTHPADDADLFIVYARKLGDGGWSDYRPVAETKEMSCTLTQADIDICCAAHALYVVAVRDNPVQREVSDPSNIVSIVCGRDFNDGDFSKYNGGGATRFLTDPPTRTEYFKEYRYDPQVAGEFSQNSFLNVSFAAITIPDGATIDAKSGEIVWVPTEAGFYDFIIEAHATGEPSGRQAWTLEVVVPGVGGPASVPAAAIEPLSIVPNPVTQTSALLRLGTVESGTTFSVVDRLGRRLLRQSIAQGNDVVRSIDVSALPSGVYFVVVERGSESRAERMVIAR